MSKRNTDTDKWKKPFIKTLKPDYKLLWLYILDDCDHAGIWHVDFEVANIRIGCKTTEKDAVKFFGEKIRPFGDNNSKWYISDFVAFQYGNNLSDKNRLHAAVRSLLEKYKLIEPNTVKGELNGLNESEGKPKISIHKRCMDIYDQWYKNKFNIKPQIDGSDAKAMQHIIKYLEGNEPGDDNVSKNWTAFLNSFSKWEAFHKKQTRIRQINSFISNIIIHVKSKSSGSVVDAVEEKLSKKSN